MRSAPSICCLGGGLQHQPQRGSRANASGIHLLWRLGNRRDGPRDWPSASRVFGLQARPCTRSTGGRAAIAGHQPRFRAAVRALLDRARPAPGQTIAAAVLAVAVAVFVAAAHPSAAVRPRCRCRCHGNAVARHRPALLAGGDTGPLGPAGRVSFCIAAGIRYGLGRGVLKAVVHTATSQPAAPSLLADLGAGRVGAWAVVIHQRAYADARLSVSLPVLTVAKPASLRSSSERRIRGETSEPRWRYWPRP